MKLYYYAHCLRNPDPEIQAENLRRATARFATMASAHLRNGVLLWAPWMALAAAGVSEDKALAVIRASVSASDAIIEDFDGQPESVGLRDEREQAEAEGKPVIEVGK